MKHLRRVVSLAFDNLDPPTVCLPYHFHVRLLFAPISSAKMQPHVFYMILFYLKLLWWLLGFLMDRKWCTVLVNGNMLGVLSQGNPRVVFFHPYFFVHRQQQVFYKKTVTWSSFLTTQHLILQSSESDHNNALPAILDCCNNNVLGLNTFVSV